MGMEIVYATLISSFFGILGLMLFQHNKEKNMELKKKYEIELFKLKKRESRKDKRLASTINTKPESSLLDLAKNIDSNKIGGILEALQGKDDYEDEQDEMLGGIGDIIAKNPDLVQSFLGGLSKKKDNNETEIKGY